ncbi:MAG TPA: biotin/lipoyl-containing protein [Bryobacteraceae bacterium]|nr:biotin/lipoyl-containing protein [Bryobacteraceae bacterium]
MNRVIKINGEPATPASEATAVEVEPGVYSVLSEGASWEVRVTGEEITIGDHRLRFEVEDPRQWRRTGAGAETHGRASILAPMPGKIVRILVKAGDDVVAGQGIVVVEAMKMQNEMKAPKDGRVTAIQVKENDSVTAGAVLAIVE